ncbi:TRAF3-interacting protein 1 [Planococcus citri]|uniref:TRAF3-interacting protein 1 n=1 Tax=Planococcus citri TaxID=170843 RepID=UPI0031F72646
MTEEVNSSLIKEVQTGLGKYIKKPPLNEKLLKKPPFRYLHDLITSIIRETGFLDGLYSATELSSENVKDKDAKLNFLDKLISAVKKVTGKNVAARSGKIIAGLEVNKTLELLLIIAKAIEDKVDSKSILIESTENGNEKAPKSIKKDDKPEKSAIPRPKPNTEVKTSSKTTSSKNDPAPAKTKPSSKSDTPSSKPTTSKQNSVNSKTETNVKRQDTEGSSNISDQPVSTKNSTKEPSRDKSLTRKNSVSDRSSASSRKSSGQSKSSSLRKPSLKDTTSSKNLNSVENVIQEEHESSSRLKEPEPASNGNVNGDIKENGHQNNILNDPNGNKSDPESTPVINDEPKIKTPPQDSHLTDTIANKKEKSPVNKKESVPVQRPGSARPGSRRVSYSNSLQNGEPETGSSKESKTEKKTDSEEPPSIPVTRPRTATRPPSARPGAPRIRDRGEVSVNDETKTPLANINVIEEGKADQIIDEKDNFIVIESEQSVPALMNDSDQINDQDQGQLVNQILQTQKELNESLTVDVSQHKHSEIEWEAGRQRERDIVGKEIDKIRSVIQTLTSAANPLGKLFDFLQEDVDEMQRELQHWKKINENLQKQQLAEMNTGKMFLQPLQKQLEDVENSIQEEYVQIANIKGTILLNDEKITKLIHAIQTRTK